MSDRIVRRLVAGLVVVPLLLLAGCTTDSFAPQAVDLSCQGTAGGPVTLVVGARANSPRPVIPEPVAGLIREAAKRGAPIQAVRVDGAPNSVLNATFHTNARNEAARLRALSAFLADLGTAVERITAKVPEADVLEALAQAAHITQPGGTVVVLDSGLQTTGLIRFQDEGTFGAEPNEVVEYLKKSGALPELPGRAVLFAGLGNTAEPQPALTQNLRNRVADLWTAIATSGDASCVADLKTASTTGSIGGNVPVTVVPLPSQPTFKACGRTVLDDSSSVAFRPDTATFRDAAAARKTLGSLADVTRAGQQHLTLTGTTASVPGSGGNGVVLSRKRAEAVADVLKGMGVPASRITTVGGGNTSKFHIRDLDGKGNLIPAAVVRNRSVVIELSCA
ncbi:hypothetical protein GCM10010172_42670 [Paractinoplanes ferrugineus]|uniref:OmpA-like domain-containing protein n=1 Tax=Paractinoplanes ferrugineus TaxID=113564 RepID=A0A919MI89_9ACTN|nr:OmpA family protein [Actinoplanes ferrugineus]GIE13425.1 hypothetical protein Afe05nite_52650 [Actinoplanes ferrugineus]